MTFPRYELVPSQSIHLRLAATAYIPNIPVTGGDCDDRFDWERVEKRICEVMRIQLQPDIEGTML
jgi:hypothetical protein